MKRWLLAVSVLVLATGASAQDKGADSKDKKVDSKAAASAPASDSKSGNDSKAGDSKASDAKASDSKAGDAKSSSSSAKTVTIRVPSGGSYSAYVQEGSAAPKSISDKGDLELPSGVKKPTVYVLDEKSGYAAKKQVDADTKEISFASPDFKLVQKVQVKVTGKDGKPIAKGSVALTDGAKNTMREIIQPSSMGTAEFKNVSSGTGSVTVTPDGGSATTKEVSLDLPKGETVQSIPVALPEVTNVVEPPKSATTGNAPAGGNAPVASGNGPAPNPNPQTAPAPAQPLPQPQGGADFGTMFLSWVILIALLVGGYLYAKKKGITIEGLMKQFGVQPEAQVQGGGSLTGANLSSGVAAPGPAPAPPPVVADPNMCQFCGQMKSATGQCACTVSPGSLSAPGFAAAPSGGGPRLVGTAGAYMGQVFPINGPVVIGRDATNSVPLDRDTTASRRHAQITPEATGFRIQDLGSSNGTFVNGQKVTDALLTSGDEVSIGGTRFRFEV